MPERGVVNYRRSFGKLFVPMTQEEYLANLPNYIGGACDSPERVHIPDLGMYFYRPEKAARRSGRARY